MTFADVVASLHSPRPGRIACIVCNACIACNARIACNDRIARIAGIACNDRNDCNDEETSNDGTRYCVLDTRGRDFATDLCHFRTVSQIGTHPVGPFQKKWDLLPFLGPSPPSRSLLWIYNAAPKRLGHPNDSGTFCHGESLQVIACKPARR